jgi:hypothetical protein
MAEHAGANKSKVKTAISAIRNQKRPDISQFDFSNSARALSLRRKLGKQLQTEFADAGLDIKKNNKILADHQSEARGVLEKEKSKSAKTFAALNKDLQREIANKKKAVEWLASRPPITTTLIPLWTAWEIGVTPVALVDTHIEPSNNWARILYTRQSDTNGNETIDVGFWFAWENPSEYLAVLNAESDLFYQGFCRAVGNPDVFWYGESWIDLYVDFKVFVGGAVVYESGFTEIARRIYGKGGAEIVLGGFGIDSLGISGSNHLATSNISVDGRQLVLFFLHFEAEYNIRNGSIDIDFDKEQDHFIMCPGVQIELLTAPPGAAA